MSLVKFVVKLEVEIITSKKLKRNIITNKYDK